MEVVPTPEWDIEAGDDTGGFGARRGTVRGGGGGGTCTILSFVCVLNKLLAGAD